MKRIRYTLLIPVEITLDKESQLRMVVADIKNNGPFPQKDSFGELCYSWRIRCDKARLKDALPGTL